MQFLFNMLNHNKMGQRSLEDVIGIMGHQMRALGHKAEWDVANDKFLPASDGVNVMVEGFTGPVIECMARAHAQGARFIILATEEPSDKGFNHGRDPEMVARQHNFPIAAQYCEGIIHLVPGESVTRWYSQFAPSAYAELGFAQSLLRVKDVTPTYEFGFYGSLSPRRLAILKRLSKMCGSNPRAVRVEHRFVPQLERDDIMRDCKVIVQIRKFEEMGLVSSSRCNTAICLGRPVIAEPHELAKPWDEVVHFAKTTDQFLFHAIAVKAAWQGVAASQLVKFREKFTPEMSIGEPLAKIGLLAHGGYGAPRAERAAAEAA